MSTELTAKQQKFVDSYDGNGAQAAKIAGYSAPYVTASQLLTNPRIRNAIVERNKEERNKLILNRQQRQIFWSNVVLGIECQTIVNDDGEKVNVPHSMKDRLKASELLGRSEADFTDIKRNEGSLELKSVAVKFVESDSK